MICVSYTNLKSRTRHHIMGQVLTGNVMLENNFDFSVYFPDFGIHFKRNENVWEEETSEESGGISIECGIALYVKTPEGEKRIHVIMEIDTSPGDEFPKPFLSFKWDTNRNLYVEV